MQGKLTKDCLGGFVERYVLLFVTEIKHFVETYSEEIKYRIQRVDQAYSVEE